MANIFLVDDDQDLAYLTRAALAKNGYDVAVFHAAEGVLEAARRQKPRLILMDVMLPGEGGGEAVRSILAEPALKDTRIVFFTALVSGGGAQDRTINVDGRSFPTFGKPYEMADLLRLVKESLQSPSSS